MFFLSEFINREQRLPLVSFCLLSLIIISCSSQILNGDSLGVTPVYGIPRYGPYHTCNREPPEVSGPKLPGDNGFKIKIIGNPQKYVPGETYHVVLQGWSNIQKYNVHKFIEFMLVVEPQNHPTENPIGVTGAPQIPDLGMFQLFSDSQSKLSDECPDGVVQTSSVPKSEISVMWTAPVSGSGCVVFKATVVERRDSWFMDDGGLTKQLCEEEAERQDEQPEILNECCACDEAKYEVTFEGLWSKYTHPKDFPPNFWLTHFSDIIGASHSGDFRMWEYGGYASEGVRQVAELGVTKKLEAELKAESNRIRTIIKARGLWYPNLNGKTFAVFRVDRLHHLMSLLSMLGPSPDWLVGVSALELCLKNCTWINEKSMNLYLWDAGTDSGITYLSSTSPTIPQERIRQITSTNPNQPESPFFDSTGARMKPIARLTVSRQRIYQKTCGADDNEDNNRITPTVFDGENEDDRPECQVTEWTDFAPCTAICGQGIRKRTRNFVHDQKARMMGCRTTLVEKEMCEANCVGEVSCATSPWSEWQECTATCGKGFRTRIRKFTNRMARKVCSDVNLVEKDVCMGIVPECTEVEEIDPKCRVTVWSEWSPCLTSCGKGEKMRTRLYKTPRQSEGICRVELLQRAPCVADQLECTFEVRDVCLAKKEAGPCRGFYPRYYYDVVKGMCLQFVYGGCRGNRNNFERQADCKRLCEDKLTTPIGALTTYGEQPGGSSSSGNPFMQPGISLPGNLPDNSDQPVIDCVVTSWTPWSSCTATCGTGRKERRREIKLNAQNGGRPCPKKLVQRRKCKDIPPCRVDCKMSIWGEWSPCSQTCGQSSGYKIRNRAIEREPQSGGTPCGRTIDYQYCGTLPPCD